MVSFKRVTSWFSICSVASINAAQRLEHPEYFSWAKLFSLSTAVLEYFVTIPEPLVVSQTALFITLKAFRQDNQASTSTDPKIGNSSVFEHGSSSGSVLWFDWATLEFVDSFAIWLARFSRPSQQNKQIYINVIQMCTRHCQHWIGGGREGEREGEREDF